MPPQVWIGGISVQATEEEFKTLLRASFGDCVTQWKFSRKVSQGRIGRGHKFCTVTLKDEESVPKMLATKGLSLKGTSLIFDAVWTKEKRQRKRQLPNQHDRPYLLPMDRPPHSRPPMFNHHMRHMRPPFPGPRGPLGYENDFGPRRHYGPPEPYGRRWNEPWKPNRADPPLLSRQTGKNPFPPGGSRPPQRKDIAPNYSSGGTFPAKKHIVSPRYSVAQSLIKPERQPRKQQKRFVPSMVSSPVSPSSPAPLSPPVPKALDSYDIPTSPILPNNPHTQIPTSPISMQNKEISSPEDEDDEKYVMKQKDFGVVTIIEDIGRSLYPIPGWAIPSSIREWYKFGCSKFRGLSEVSENEFAALLHRWLCITTSVKWNGPGAPDEDIDTDQPWASRLLSDETPTPAHINGKQEDVQEDVQEQDALEHFL